MSSKMVWSRFESMGKNGKLHKLRIQDLPSTRISDALDLFTKYFIRDEALCKASDIRNSPTAVKNLSDYYNHTLHDPSCHKVICCSDDTDDVEDIMSVSVMRRYTDEITKIHSKHYSRVQMLNSPEKLDLNRMKFLKMIYEMETLFDPVKEYKLDVYYGDVGAVIAPPYRGLGIIDQYSKIRRMICEAHKVPMTGAWMTAHATQRAAAVDGWETVREIAFDYFAKKYDVTFTNTPPTLKLMIGRATTSS
ncbi:hypothetical protein MSG28_004251 [Choristoneura fumiferana]|uniref:Uncharacterized protein n=3 Tax=Choristoneura fumiferana TaxID=7141 RepID=A0ACC0KJD8_CHOFU|nr:hypothetical protein MSG28_004251 [Choristoneura fumiferana]KAI8436172.1 hypothetical protein MSG28_004251 [Choristoneura fumiferana]